MNAVLERPATSPYSAKTMSKPTNFYYAMPDAKSVNLMGDFNDWNPTSSNDYFCGAVRALRPGVAQPAGPRACPRTTLQPEARTS